MKEHITKGSGNVFADLGFENPVEYQAKSRLSIEIIRLIEQRKLTQKEAAVVIGAAQPDISKLKNGQLNGFTMDRLFSFLLRLDQNIQIQVKPRGKNRRARLDTRFAA